MRERLRAVAVAAVRVAAGSGVSLRVSTDSADISAQSLEGQLQVALLAASETLVMCE
jgi:hypothetical protein